MTNEIREAAERVRDCRDRHVMENYADLWLLADAFVDLELHLARGFMTCNSSPDGRYEIVIRFKTLEEAQEMHRHLLGIELKGGE